MRRFALALAALLAAAPAHAALFVYVACADGPEIDLFSMDPSTGAVTKAQTVTEPGAVGPIVISSDHRHLYAAMTAKPYLIDNLAIDPKTARLTEVETQPIVAGMGYLGFDKTGHVLLSASDSGSLVSTNRLDPKGAMDPQPIQVLDTKPHAQAFFADSTNKFAFATILGGDTILQFKLDAATGKFTPNAPDSLDTAHGAGPGMAAVAPSERFVYVADVPGGSVDVYSFNFSKGTLAPAQTIRAAPDDLQGTPALGDLRITPDGRFLYVSERSSGSITEFRVDRGTGHLALIGRVPSEADPRSFAIDPQGRYLLAVGLKSNAMTVYAINRTSGVLKAVQHADTGKSPGAVAFLETAP